MPGRETGSVCDSAHQQSSFLSPPVHCSRYYISCKPLVIFGGRYVRRTSSYLGAGSVSECDGRYKLSVSGWMLIYTVLEGNHSEHSPVTDMPQICILLCVSDRKRNSLFCCWSYSQTGLELTKMCSLKSSSKLWCILMGHVFNQWKVCML